MRPSNIPITVLGGYLGAGKTTLLNRLLAAPGGRRLGVIVNDFGSLAIDVELLDAARSDDGSTSLVSLPNGCVCCALGADLYDALRSMIESPLRPDHIVIEASGVADPATAAAWGTRDGFEPGGVIVLAAADTVRRQSRDKYVGGEVRRQLAGADLIITTKHDLCTAADLSALDSWLDTEATGVPHVAAIDGEIPVDVVLGVRPEAVAEQASHRHTDLYVTWSWTGDVVSEATIEALFADLPVGLLRLKGIVERPDGTQCGVQVVGRSRHSWGLTSGVTPRVRGSRVVAIGVRGVLDVGALDHLFSAGPATT